MLSSRQQSPHSLTFVRSLALAAFLTGALCLYAFPQTAGPPAEAVAGGGQAVVRTRSYPLAGMVVDPSGAAVAGAEVTLRAGARTRTTRTDSAGRFEFGGVPTGAGVLAVQASGFARAERKWNAEENHGRQLEITLTPAVVTARVTVTATRTAQRLNDTAAGVTVLTSEDLDSTAALTFDDKLRQVPGFQLFRRSGSRVANPTSQGVSLRGVGASGASRALVLEDGIPLNDPFGGWVYWDRVPREAVSAIEVVRGGTSNLYGTDAVGGVINFIPRKNTASNLALETSFGNELSPDASASASLRLGRWIATADGEAFHTDGYFIVPEDVRGRVDSRSNSDYRATDLILERIISERTRAFVRGSYFSEARDNGQLFLRNHTAIRQLAAGADWQSDTAGAFSVRLYGGPEVFDQNFFATALNRNSENLTRLQRSPSQQFGASGQWTRAAGVHQTFVAGLEGDEVRGSSNELIFSPVSAGSAGGQAAIFPSLQSAVGAGGRQNTIGVFGEDIVRLQSRWIVTVGARYDHWRNFDALSVTRPLSTAGAVTVRNFAERTESAFSPRLSLLYRLRSNVSLTASGYRAFRAPTLNELYRSFRVGNILTQSNSQLVAEHLTGGEAGANFTALNQRLAARAIFFWNDITRPVANVTLSVTPTLITRQRQNLGRTRSRGVDLDVTARLTHTIDLSGGYELGDSTVVRFPSNTALEGLLIPQVPRQQFTFQARYSNSAAASRLARVTLAVQGRAVGAQFDDDQNQLKLARYFTIDTFLSHGLGHGAELFAAGENLTGQRYQVGRTPVLTIGPPALVRIGFRMELGGR
jgi:outer membrane receptor protein involved in Fe transport